MRPPLQDGEDGGEGTRGCQSRGRTRTACFVAVGYLARNSRRLAVKVRRCFPLALWHTLLTNVQPNEIEAINGEHDWRFMGFSECSIGEYQGKGRHWRGAWEGTTLARRCSGEVREGEGVATENRWRRWRRVDGFRREEKRLKRIQGGGACVV